MEIQNMNQAPNNQGFSASVVMIPECHTKNVTGFDCFQENIVDIKKILFKKFKHLFFVHTGNCCSSDLFTL